MLQLQANWARAEGQWIRLQHFLAYFVLRESQDPVTILFQMKPSFMQIDLVTMSELILHKPPIFTLDEFRHSAWGIISITAVNSGHWLWLYLWISFNFNAFWKHWCAIYLKQEACSTDPLPKFAGLEWC